MRRDDLSSGQSKIYANYFLVSDSMRNFSLQLKPYLVALLWSLAFAIAYTQSPLYTSNQNQYFLHGLAQAGFGHLVDDWLANTSDPTPVFSQMVSLIYSYLRWEGFFYVVYAILMGIYLYSLWGIGSVQYELQASTGKKMLFLALLVVLHSAGLRYALSRIVGVNWTYVFEDGVADQRLLGPVLQPSTFGVFLLLSIYLFLRRRHFLAIFAAVLAATFHPTYILSAATLTAAYMLSVLKQDRNWKMALALGVTALLAITPVLLTAFPVFAGAPSGLVLQARQILVEYRIPHHALVSWWFDATAVVKIVIALLAVYLVRRTRLFLVLVFSIATAGLVTLVQLALDSTALALLFPWRLSTFIVPLSTAIILAYLVDRFLDTARFHTPQAQRAIVALSTSLVILSVVVGAIRFTLDLQRKASDPERAIETYVAAHRLPKELYLIPMKMQDFRLVAGVPALVEFKSIPYRAEDVLEWFRREQMAARFYKTGDCAVLEEILANYEVTHVITEAGQREEACPQLESIYRDSAYSLWRTRSQSQ